MSTVMSWGKSSRLREILQPDGRALMLAIDHGYFMGPTRGVEIPSRTLAPLLAQALELVEALATDATQRHELFTAHPDDEKVQQAY